MYVVGHSFIPISGKDNNPPKTVVVTKYEEYMKIAVDKTKEITEVFLPDETKMSVTYKSADGYEPVDPKCSVIHGLWTTSLARVKLYKALHTLGTSVLYFDTGNIPFLYF